MLILITGYSFTPLMPNFYAFMVFYLFLPSMAFSLATFPAFACLWSYFPTSQGKVTGIVGGILGFSSFIFLIGVTYLFNPNNQPATLETQEGKQTFKYFDYNIVQNKNEVLLFIALSVTFFSVVGAVLIDYQEDSGKEET